MTTPPLAAARAYDPAAAVRALATADPQLGRLVAAVGPPTIAPSAGAADHGFTDVYGSLFRAIVSQQLSTKAAATIHGRTLLLFDQADPDVPVVPAPEQLLEAAPELLRSAGISGNKARALHDLAAKVLDGTVPDADEADTLGDDELIARISAVRGIGEWTVQMLLIFRLGRPDVLPTGDLGVRKGFQRTFGTAELPTPTELTAHAEAWRPWRSVASWYLWRANDLPPELDLGRT